MHKKVYLRNTLRYRDIVIVVFCEFHKTRKFLSIPENGVWPQKSTSSQHVKQDRPGYKNSFKRCIHQDAISRVH